MEEATELAAQCYEMFSAYPLAADPGDDALYMTVLLPGGDTPRFAGVVYRDGSATAHPWNRGETVSVADAVANGVPVPRDGSLLGYSTSGRITALMPFCARHRRPHPGSPCPVPSWAIMARADERPDLWSALTGRPLLGGWFWELHRAGRIIDLAPVIAASPGAVFWAGTDNAAFCAVARDLEAARGVVLPCGAWAWHSLLREGAVVPSLDALLADPGKTDLAPSFAPVTSPLGQLRPLQPTAPAHDLRE